MVMSIQTILTMTITMAITKTMTMTMIVICTLAFALHWRLYTTLAKMGFGTGSLVHYGCFCPRLLQQAAALDEQMHNIGNLAAIDA